MQRDERLQPEMAERKCQSSANGAASGRDPSGQTRDSARPAIEDRRNGVREQAGPTKHGGDIGAGVGIPGMRERLRQHSGSLEIRSDPTGTTLTAVEPLTGHATQSTQRSQGAGQR